MPSKKEAALKPAFSISAATLDMPDAGFDKLCASIKGRGQSLQKDMHVAACVALKHAIQHKDIRRAAKLLEAMPESARTNALRTWFEFYGPIKFEKNKPLFDRARNQCDMQAAINEPFWLLAPEPEYKPLDEFKLLDDVMKRLRTDAEKTGRDHSAMLNGLQALKLAQINPAVVAEAEKVAA